MGYAPAVPAVRKTFDSAYYARFYGDPSTRISDAEEDSKLARFVLAYLDYLGATVRTVLDLGCGNGRWKAALHSVDEGLAYTGVEISEVMCAEHGWHHGSVVDWDGPPADLVVCHGVLQYLSDKDAKTAIANLGRLAKTALYLELVTKEDWEDNVDQALTDGEINFRPVAWYRKHLAKHFVSAGGGVFVPHQAPIVLYELERGA